MDFIWECETDKTDFSAFSNVAYSLVSFLAEGFECFAAFDIFRYVVVVYHGYDGKVVVPSEEGIEQVDCVLDRASKLIQAWEQRLTLKNLALAKRYLEGKLRILVHARNTSGRFKNPKEFCAVFQRELPIGGRESYKHLGDCLGEFHGAKGCSDIQDDVPMGSTYKYRKFVFLCDTESIELPEGVIPSLVRFESLNDSSHVCGNALYFSHSNGWKFINITENGESATPVEHCRISGSHEVANHVVKNGPEIVSNLSDDNGESERDFLDDLKRTDPIAGLLLFISNNAIWLGREKGIDFNLEITDLLFGPFDFSLELLQHSY